MISELYEKNHRLRRRILWTIVYITIGLSVIAALYWTADQFRIRPLPTGTVELDVSHSKYVVGEPVEFTLHNNLNAPIHILNKCPSEPLEIYKLNDGRWSKQHDSINRSSCTDDLRQLTIPAHGVITGDLSPWKNLFTSPGSYRIAAIIDNYRSLPYIDFEIVSSTQSSNPNYQNKLNSNKAIPRFNDYDDDRYEEEYED